MNIEKKVFDIKDCKTYDVKNNKQMAEWTKDVFFELNQKLEEHYQKEITHYNENI